MNLRVSPRRFFRGWIVAATYSVRYDEAQQDFVIVCDQDGEIIARMTSRYDAELYAARLTKVQQ